MTKINQSSNKKIISTEKEAFRLLSEAILVGSCCKVRQAILIGADVKGNNNRPIKIAAGAGYLEIVKILEENGSNIHASDEDPLRLSAKFGKLDVFKYLHQKGAKISASNYSALINAINEGHIEIVKYIHQSGVKLDVSDNEPLKACLRTGNDKILTYLIENGCTEKNLPDSYKKTEFVEKIRLKRIEIEFNKEVNASIKGKQRLKSIKVKRIGDFKR